MMNINEYGARKKCFKLFNDSNLYKYFVDEFNKLDDGICGLVGNTFQMCKFCGNYLNIFYY